MIPIPTEQHEIKLCADHGAYTATGRELLGKVLWTYCPQCVADRAEKQRKMDEDQERYKFEQRVKDSEIPERFKDRTLASYQATSEGQKKALAFCEDYASSFSTIRKTGRSAIFLGKPGTGKTHLAIGIGLEVLRQKQGLVMFTSASRLLRRIKDSYRKGSHESEREAYAVFTTCELLIIDEIGIQFGTEYEKNTLFDVINERYENLRPTILLSNLAMDEVKGYLGDRTFDRMRENGGQAIAFTWGSHRGAQS